MDLNLGLPNFQMGSLLGAYAVIKVGSVLFL